MKDDQGWLFDDARRKRDDGMDRVERNAGKWFSLRAQQFIPTYLFDNGPTSGELIVNACKKKGIIPHNDRAFGPVLLKLSREQVIEKDGSAPRLKGHLAPGATIWKLSNGLD